MARLLPFRRSDRAREPREPRLVDIGDDEADAVFAALSAETARDILGRLYREPGTATDVAEAADTSLQNARYHLEKLQSAGLVEPVDTWYSSRGTEMTVYAPTSEPLVVAAGPEEQTSLLRSALGRLVGALAVLGIASLLVDRLVRSGLAGIVPLGGTGGAEADGGAATEFQGQATTPRAGGGGSGGTGDAGGDGAANVTEAATETAAEETATAAGTSSATPAPSPSSTPTPTEAADVGLLDLAGGLPPGGLFFLGGLVVIAVVAAWWYWRRYRPLYG